MQDRQSSAESTNHTLLQRATRGVFSLMRGRGDPASHPVESSAKPPVADVQSRVLNLISARSLNLDALRVQLGLLGGYPLQDIVPTLTQSLEMFETMTPGNRPYVAEAIGTMLVDCFKNQDHEGMDAQLRGKVEAILGKILPMVQSQPRRDLLVGFQGLPMDLTLGVFSNLFEQQTDQDQSLEISYVLLQQLTQRLQGLRQGTEPLSLSATERTQIQDILQSLQQNLRQVASGSSPNVQNILLDGQIQEFLRMNPEIALPELIKLPELDTYHGISLLLMELPGSMKTEVEQVLIASLQNDAAAPTRLAVLDQILQAKDTTFLAQSADLNGKKHNRERLVFLMSDSSIKKVLEALASKKEQFVFQLGVLLSLTSLNQISESLRTKLNGALGQIEQQIKLTHEGWTLCPLSEPRLIDMMNHSAVVLVSDCLLAKVDGKTTALCIKTTTLPNRQTFVEGNWYSPTDQVSRDAIKHAYDAGETRVKTENGVWAIMRPAQDYLPKAGQQMTASQVLARAKAYAASMPDRIPDRVKDMPRVKYRTETEEKQTTSQP